MSMREPLLIENKPLRSIYSVFFLEMIPGFMLTPVENFFVGKYQQVSKSTDFLFRF